MQPITHSDLEMFKERSRTELRSNCDVTRLAWDDVVPALCNEVLALRKQLSAKEEALKDCKVFLGETIQCGVEGEMLDGRHVNVAASDLADKIDDVLKGNESAGRPVDGMTFGQAIEAMKQGKKVARRGWNGKGMFLWLKPATSIKAEWCKDEMLKGLVEDNGGEILGLGTICMYTHDSTGRRAILTGWLASQSDMLYDDWMVVE